jgi:hypothetical protein
MIYVTGYTQGDLGRFLEHDALINKLGWNDYLIICGGFGFITDGTMDEEYELDQLARLPYHILFIDGNRENFDELYDYPVSKWNGGDVHKIRGDKVIHLMRGQIYNIEGKKIFTMGGGFSVERYSSEEGKGWFEEELPNYEEYEEGRLNLRQHNYEVDYIITHELPEDSMKLLHPPHYAVQELQGYLEWVGRKVAYKHWYMGHLLRDEDLWRYQTVLWHDVREIESNDSVLEIELRKKK